MQSSASLQLPGVYSTQSKIPKRMDGLRIHAFSHKIYWYVERDADGKISVRPLNANFLPSGVRIPVSEEELSSAYTPEQAFYDNNVLPAINRLNGILDRADEQRGQNQNTRAVQGYSRAMSMDEQNIRAHFGAGLSYLALGEKDKAKDILKRLMELEGTFEKQHKHMFNEFGISMRKNKLFEEAVRYYGRALELSKEDENLHINIARPLCEQKMFATAAQHLIEALRLAPGHKTAREFLSWLQDQQVIPLRLESAVKEALENKTVPRKTDEFTLPDNLFE